MRRDRARTSGLEPLLGGEHGLHLTGMEPALSREFGRLYGRFRLQGLEAPPVAGRRRPLVVLAEIDPDTSHLIHLLADSNGYEVRLTDNGLEAWRMTAALEPDLLVVNLRLAGTSGLAVIDHVRASDDASVRLAGVLVMDVHRRKQDVLVAFERGADDYLPMPYDLPVMLRAWRRVISAVRRPSPITALLNEDTMIRQVALAYLLDRRPDGLAAGLGELAWHHDAAIRASARWALRRLGTVDALAVLEQCHARFEGL